MITPDQIQTIQHSLAEADTVLVLFAPQASVDQVAAATALFQGLESLKKSVTLLSPIKPTAHFNVIEGIDQVGTSLGNKNLQVTFDYQADMVDKVSYHIDEEAEKFHLIIMPRKGARPLDAKTVEYSYTGAEADVIFLVGVGSLDSLDQLYIGYEQLFSDAMTVSINTYETAFGSLKLSTEGAASTSEVVAYLLQQLDVQFSSEIATNLITGIEGATDKLQSLAATADTFEILSKLLRAGGRRVARAKASARGVSPVEVEDDSVKPIQIASTNSFAQAVSKVGKSKKVMPVEMGVSLPTN